MTANPMTDQILAAAELTMRRQPPPPNVIQAFKDFADDLAATLPGIDPATVGQVLLHAGDHYRVLCKTMWDVVGRGPSREDAGFTIGLLVGAGRQLYTGQAG